MTLDAVLFWLFALIACGSALAVVVSQNVVRMAFWLVMALGSVAALFFLLHADFVGATQLLIYVGGTVVLLVFGVMLTATGPYVQIKTAPGEGLLGGCVGGLLLLVLAYSVAGVDWSDTTARVPGKSPAFADQGRDLASQSRDQAGKTSRSLGLAFLGLRPDAPPVHGTSAAPGYLLPFEIVSVHLLVVLVGAAYLARAKRRLDVET